MAKIKRPLLFTLSLLPIALVAGYFVGLYQLSTYSEETLSELMSQIGSEDVFIAVCIAQTVGYAIFCGFFGYILAEKIGLIKPLALNLKALFVTIAVSLVGGALFSLDYWTFGAFIDGVKESAAASVSRDSIIAMVLYGGIIEEVMMRLFVMSLIAFILWKLFFRSYDGESLPTGVFVLANILAALGFAAGHLPATLLTFGTITPLILFRCFLLNGGFALIFGRLYRKYGIFYAMLAHTMFHVVSKGIYIIFI